jgi:uncharacterized protein (DUF58 family)
MLLEEVQSYTNLELLARQVVEGFITGIHRSPFHGFSVEFAEHRPYNPGESTKNIDWKLFARTDRIYTKRFEEETNLRCRMLLDISGSMFFPQENAAKIRFSVLAAASICQLLQGQRDAFGIGLFDSEIRHLSPLRSSRSHLIETLSKLQPLWENPQMPAETGDTHIAKSLEQIAATSHKRSLIVVFSDMFENTDNQEPLWQALQHLKYAKNEVILFHVQHESKESKLMYENRPMRFVDAESGDKIILNPAEVKEAYAQQSLLLEKSIKQRCLQYNIDFYPINVEQDFHQVLLPFYLKRMKMS